jgi:hypothetical protein
MGKSLDRLRQDIEKSVDLLQITKSFSYNYCIIAQKERRK